MCAEFGEFGPTVKAQSLTQGRDLVDPAHSMTAVRGTASKSKPIAGFRGLVREFPRRFCEPHLAW